MITYNHQDFIESAILGVLNQETNFNYELIISNDNSIDKTHQIISKIIDNHPKKDKVKYFNNEENLGMMTNYINTLKKCTGKYIAICDGDDYWIDKTKLQMQFDFLMENKECGLVYTLKKNLYPDGKFIDDKPISTDQRTTNIDDLLNQNYICASTILFRNKIMELNFADWYYASPYGDWPLYMYLLQNGEEIFCIDKITTVYRKNVGITTGVTNNAIKSLENQFKVFDGMQSDSNYNVIHNKISKRIYNLKVNLMAVYNKERLYLSSLKCFITLITSKSNNLEFKVFKVYLKSLFKGLKIIK